MHQATCGGSFEKISGPDSRKKTNRKKRARESISEVSQDRRNTHLFGQNPCVHPEVKSDNIIVISCPICGTEQNTELELNHHLDECLSHRFFIEEYGNSSKTINHIVFDDNGNNTTTVQFKSIS